MPPSLLLLAAAALIQLVPSTTQQLSATQLSAQSDVQERAMFAPGGSQCQFANGSRVTPLPPGFFGPEPCVFADHMVLRSADSADGSSGALIWGFSAPGSRVGVLVDGSAGGTAVTDRSGRWELSLKINASQVPRTLVFRTGSQSSSITDVLFGDVWLCSGQSNMDFVVDAHHGAGGCFAANQTVQDAAAGKYNDIRLMHGGATGLWFNASYQGGSVVAGFSAVCYLSAVEMKEQVARLTERPMGLIQASVGGTVIEEWMSTAALEACLLPNQSIPHEDCAAGSQKNSDLYYSFIDPLTPLSLTGALWYQGESNVPQNFDPSKPNFEHYYSCMFKSKVESWRRNFRSPNMFYGFVSLAAYGHGDASPTSRSTDPLPVMRIDQSAVLSLPNTAAVLALDLGDDGKTPVTPPSSRHGGIHPRNKTEVARRMALSYARVGLGLEEVVSEGPVLQSMERSADGRSVELSFRNTGGGLSLSPTAQCDTHAGTDVPAMRLDGPEECCSESPRLLVEGMPADAGVPFELESTDGTTQLVGQVVVSHDRALLTMAGNHSGMIRAVRYGYQSYPYCVLRNAQMLPAMPFFSIG